MVNSLCGMIGQPAFYAVAEQATAESAGIVGGEFYGQPLATVVRKILEKRRIAQQGPASVAEIYDAMLMGDYAFETKNTEKAKSTLRISLTKNPLFHRLPSGTYGLREWYPALKDRKGRGKAELDDEDTDEVASFQENFEASENGDAKKVAS